MAVTEAKAQRALAAVERQFSRYIDRCVIPADEAGPELVLEGLPRPTLNMDWDGQVAIIWEDGPDEWAYRATSGGTSEEERCLAADAAQEFGARPEALMPKPDDPIRWPKGVSAEPYNSRVLVLYPD